MLPRTPRTPAAWAALLFALLLAVGCQEGAPAPRPVGVSFLLVTVEGSWSDDTAGERWSAAAVPGAVELTDAATSSPQVLPAVASALTGAAPDRLGVFDDLTPLGKQPPVLADLLSRHGHATAAFVTNPLVGRGSGLETGFELFDAPRAYPFGPERFIPPLRPATEAVANLLSWVRGLPEERPFFAWLHVVGTTPARPMRPDAPEHALNEALTQLHEALAGEPRLAGCSVLVLGTSGPLDESDGAASGYFLTPQILRVRGFYRAGRGVEQIDGTLPFHLPDAAALVLRDTGVTADLPDGSLEADAARPRFAWTLRGAREFRWPAEAGLITADTLQVVDSTGGRWGFEWPGGAAREPDPATFATLEGRRGWLEALESPAIPTELQDELRGLGIELASVDRAASPPRDERMALVPQIFDARELSPWPRKAGQIYTRVAEQDPANIGVRAEPGALLALAGMPQRAKRRLEPAAAADPHHPEAWHWLAHVALAEGDVARADALLRLVIALGGSSGDVLYDLACARSLANDLEAAEDSLRQAWRAGYRDLDHIQADPDLRALRASPRYARLMQEVQR